MTPIWFYLIHLAALCGGVAVLVFLRKRGVSWTARVMAGMLMCLAMAVFVFRISEPPDLFSDFYKAYYPAGKAIMAGGGDAGLAATMQRGAGGFVNLPILAGLFAPFALMPPVASGYVLFLLGIVATLGAWFSLSRLAGLDREKSLVLLFLFAASGPLHNSLREGNTTHFILLLLVFGLWVLRGNRDFAAGLIFGFAALIKLPLLLLGIYFFARGRWRVAMGGALVCGLAAVLSVALLGWDLHVFWYEHSIKPFAETPLAAFNVQSVQGFFARLQFGGRHLLDWTPHALEPAVRIGSKLAALLLLGLVAAVIFWPRKWRRGRTVAVPMQTMIEWEACMVVMLAMMISTVSWSHYYLWMLLPAAFFMGGAPPVPEARWLRTAGWVALVAALPPVIIVHFSNPLLGKIHGYLAVSHYLFSALLLLLVFLIADWRAAPTESDKKPS